MEIEAVMSRNRIELRVIRSMVTLADAWMTIGNEGHAISYPVRTQLGMTLSVIDGDDIVSLRYGRLIINDGGRSARPARSTKKPTFGMIHYLANLDVDKEAQERFQVKLHVPTEEYEKLWELGSRGNIPRTIQLQVRGLQSDGQWDLSETGSMLLIEDFSFSFLIDPGGLINPG
jgi:hypothetical protein